MRRAFLTPLGVVAPADRGRQPDAPTRIHHRVVRVGRRIENDLVVPVGRRLEPGSGRKHRGHHLPRFPQRDIQLGGLMTRRVGDHELVAGDRHAIHEAVRIDHRIALVGRDLVVYVRRLARPFPHRQHQVSLDTPGPRRRHRHLAGGDPVAPVGEHREPAVATEPVENAAHLRSALSERQAVIPGRDRRIEPGEMAGVKGEPIAHLMTQLTALLGDVDPGSLTL